MCSVGYIMAQFRHSSEMPADRKPATTGRVEKRPATAAAIIREGSLSERTATAARGVLAGRQGGARAYLAFVGPAVVASIACTAPLVIPPRRNLAQMCPDQFPGPVVYAMWVASEIAAMATDLAEFLGGAIGLALLFGMRFLAAMMGTPAIV